MIFSLEVAPMQVALQRARSYLKKRLLGPTPLLLLAGLNAGSAFGSINNPLAILDMDVFRASGRALVAGHPPYGVTEINNMNAPGSLPFLQAAAAILGPAWTPTVWFFGSLAAYLLSLFILTRIYPQTTTPVALSWALAQYGIWITIGYGELYAFLILLLAIAYWATIRDRLVVAGLSAGLLIAFKPNFTLWPLLLLVSGRRRLGIAFLAGTAVWSLLPILLYGFNVYFEWLQMVQARLPLELAFGHNSSLQSLAYRHGIAWAGMPLSISAVIGLALWGWKTRPEPARAAPVALLTAILASPISMPGYLTFLVPSILSRSWNRPLRVAAALMLVPLWLEQFVTFDFKTPWSAEITVIFGLLALGFLLPDHFKSRARSSISEQPTLSASR